MYPILGVISYGSFILDSAWNWLAVANRQPPTGRQEGCQVKVEKFHSNIYALTSVLPDCTGNRLGVKRVGLGGRFKHFNSWKGFLIFLASCVLHAEMVLVVNHYHSVLSTCGISVLAILVKETFLSRSGGQAILFFEFLFGMGRVEI